MGSTTINVSVKVPKSYSTALLQKQLADYARRLIASSKPVAKTKHYRHESLCGIFNSGASEEELIENYLQEKYQLKNAGE